MYNNYRNAWDSQQAQYTVGDMSQRRITSESDLGRNQNDEPGNHERREPIPSDDDEDDYYEDDDDSYQPYKRKRYHRHSQHQIREMESFFKECPHPDDKQRKELGRELGLNPSQIKFWFQNKRTQLKSVHERHENCVLNAENEKLRGENSRLKEALANAPCLSCGGSSGLGERSLDEQQLRKENTRLKGEVIKLTTSRYSSFVFVCFSFANISIPISNLGVQLIKLSFQIDRISGTVSMLYAEKQANWYAPPPPQNHISWYPLDAGLGNTGAQAAPSGMLGGNDPTRPTPIATYFDTRIITEIGMVAMEELLRVALSGEPLWVPGNHGTEILSEDAYLRIFPRGIGPSLLGVKTEASRHSDVVFINSSKLVQILMDVNQWSKVFCSIVSKAVIHEVLSTGAGSSYDGAAHLMSAEFQIPTPLLSARDNLFVRYCKKQEGQSWAVVDYSMDHLRPTAMTRSRRRPSGCLIQEMPNGYSKVTWVEHVELEDNEVHDLYKILVNSGLAFGAKRWMAALDRQCERLASAMATNIPQVDLCGVITSHEGRKGLLKLAERMIVGFCNGAGASTAHAWTLLKSGLENIRCMTRQSKDDPSRPPGTILSAATSLWLPVPAKRVFDFLRDETFRYTWDILSSGGSVHELAHIANGQNHDNYVSLLRVNSLNSAHGNMLILQESCTDATGSFVVYAPLDIAAMNVVLGGGNPDYVALLPSGFAVLPDGPELGNTGPIREVGSGGCLLTVAFQILVDSIPTSKLSAGSVNTVYTLINNTVDKIKTAVSLDT
ncbi:hypothetical protein VNO78_19323 [Psophocarpus tetragonolobus]|uniref:Uncharacterized protein n=1 Tax=Psophocarpus tetragonolobus TaxID=3891 RepID=A0AAN9S839_PSOTE